VISTSLLRTVRRLIQSRPRDHMNRSSSSLWNRTARPGPAGLRRPSRTALHKVTGLTLVYCAASSYVRYGRCTVAVSIASRPFSSLPVLAAYRRNCKNSYESARQPRNELEHNAQAQRNLGKVPQFESDVTKAPDNRPRADAWMVYENYTISCVGENGARFIHAPKALYQEGRFHKNPPKEFRSGEDWYTLAPHMSSQGLFMEFAFIAENGGLDVPPRSQTFDTDRNAQVARTWALKWGVLGLTRNEDGSYDTRGGMADTVAAFAFQAWAASSVFRLYEEATATDGDIDTAVIGELLVDGGYSPDAARFSTRTQEVAKEYAIHACEVVTQARVRDYCYPALFRAPGRYNYAPGYGCANLLGAIWMGMFWILWSDQTRRCRNPECNHIIPYYPTPERRGSKKNDRREGYATRSDKVYCSRKCEKRHYYLRYTKPAREATKSLRG
jgi:hypothetical protein